MKTVSSKGLYLFYAGITAVLIYIWIFLVPSEFGADTPIPFKEIICIFIGILVICATGLLLEYSSLSGGLLVLSQVIPIFIYYYINYLQQTLGYFIIGIIAGGILCYQTIPAARYDNLARMTKYIFAIYSGLVLSILIYEIFWSYGKLIISGSFSEIFIQIPFLAYLILSLIGLGMLILAFKDIRGVNASEVFIYGDTRSGKSVFLATLFHYGVRNLDGQVPDEVIIGSDTAERDLSLPFMVNRIREGKPPKGTEIGEIALYVIKGQMKGILPFRTPLQITMIDYAGGFTDVITNETYHSAVKLLSDELKQSYDVIDSKMGTKAFLEELKTQFRETFNQNYNIIIPAYLYKRLILSGKIIFLMNGEYITGEQPNFIQYLMKISKLMKHLGRNKSYAFVITKADEVEKGIRGMDDQNPVADMMEREIYDRLIHIYDLFSAIIHTHIVQFFIISVDNTQRVGNEITRLAPWRFLQLIQFISRNM